MTECQLQIFKHVTNCARIVVQVIVIAIFCANKYERNRTF